MIVSRKMAEDAALIFGFDIDSGLLAADQINAAYRAEAKKAHPDLGGSPEAFAAVDRAKHILLAWLERQGDSEPTKPHGGVTVCPRCDGRGFLELRRGFAAPLRRQCPTCTGSGEIYDEKDKGVDRV